ncbi:hypothetical protein [Lachnoclostridium sp. MSJ-17]|uniref:hypothetical protein n=1 Tax=Lachnoclostridium sp. MSJ-17 TaxID=2841516 RepID=UPI001C103A42|nr:hypothetical protein [Lachnoclostridium sp. MSJ-17]MBU5461118.1 hypothetical protein [Lachnoclostridium sp. MSJ-17]
MTKSRKKILLSSIAMLLVALVALGSATFAWFTVQKTVTADTMKVSATAKKGIEITIDNGATVTSATKRYTVAELALQPVSWISDKDVTGMIPNGDVTNSDGTYSGTYKSAGSVPAAVSTSGSEGVSTDANSTYFRVYRVGVRSAQNSDNTYTPHTLSATVTISAGDTTDATNYARVALCKGTTVLSTYSDTALTATTNKPINASGTATGVATVASGTATTDATHLKTDNAGTIEYYDLVVWFEGTDSDCKDSNVDKSIKVAISFTATDM